MLKAYWMFEDKSEDVEFSERGDAIEYKAWGLVTCIQLPVGRSDGNVLGVLYRSPSGRLFRRWRQLHEVNLKEIEEKEWLSIQDVLLLMEDDKPEAVMESHDEIPTPSSQTVH